MRRSALWLAALLLAAGINSASFANDSEDVAPGKPQTLHTPDTVRVVPAARDSDIEERLRGILKATGWFHSTSVTVDEGVVFLSGNADAKVHVAWAGDLATNTQDVVAVVNNLKVPASSAWDFSRTWDQLRDTAVRASQATPLIFIGLGIIVAAWLASSIAVKGARRILQSRVESLLLRQVLGRAIAIPIFLFALYLVLQLSGLTSLAFTVVGGTGIVGLILGFAFRDIAENFLASILISSQRPFAINDLIEVAGYKGFVQRVNTRSTLLMTLEGNHVQIPNSAVYKGTIINYTANPKLRADFTVGIGYSDSIKKAQATALGVLKAHPAIVDDPEPLVLVNSLSPSTVDLAIFFWIDVSRFSQIRVLSAVIRLTKRAFDRANISMPDEAREVVFPEGLAVDLTSSKEAAAQASEERGSAARAAKESTGENDTATNGYRLDDASNSTESEGELISEATEILAQAAAARVPEGSEHNLIEDEPKEATGTDPGSA